MVNRNPDGAERRVVPVHSAKDIERIAERTLAQFDPESLQVARPTALEAILIGTGTNFATRDIGYAANGRKILGNFIPPDIITIDSSIAGSVRFTFSLGHELGHRILHEKIRPEDVGDAFTDQVDPRTLRPQLLTNKDWAEWQANRFAQAIVMPRATARDAVVEIQAQMGISRGRRGRVYVGWERESRRDFKRLIHALADRYNTTPTTAEYRLATLGILTDGRDRKGLRHVTDLRPSREK